jgi:hypothetical protein
MKLQEIKDVVHADTISCKHGVYTARWGFFYTHGGSADGKCAKVMAAFPQARVIDSGEVWRAFSGGAPVAAQSHWFVKFTLDGSSVVAS